MSRPGLLLVALAGCATPPPAPTTAAERLLGSWEFDLASLEDSPRYTQLTPAQRRQARAQLETIELRFTPTHLRRTEGDAVEEHPYVIAATDGTRYVLHTRIDERTKRAAHVVLSGDRLTFDVGGNRVAFRRKR